MTTVIFKNDRELVDALMRIELLEHDCTITTMTPVKCLKKSRITKEAFEDVFQKEIYKLSSKKVVIGKKYSELLSQYGEIHPENDAAYTRQLPWGEWVEGSNDQFITHKESFYLRTYLVEKGSSEYTYVYADNTDIEPDKIAHLQEFLPSEKSSSEEEPKKVILNNVKVCNILKIEFPDFILERE